jgi:hypothetical protein
MCATIDTIETMTRHKGSGSMEDGRVTEGGRVTDREIFKCRVVCRNLGVAWL